MAKLDIVDYWIESDKIPLNFDRAGIVFLTDLHDNSYGKHNSLLIEAIEKQQPDYIMTAGDLVTGKKDFDGTTSLRLIKELTKRWPVYYANGNHEKKLASYPETKDTTYVEYKERLRDCGVRFLCNDSVRLTRGKERVRLTGLDLELEFYRKWRKNRMEPDYLASRLGRVKKEEYTILLAHNPDYFPEYAEWGADLVLSGHVHGGLLIFPGLGGFISPSYQLFPKYDFGVFEEGTSRMILSRGLGNHTIKLRFRNRPELSVIHLKSLAKRKGLV